MTELARNLTYDTWLHKWTIDVIFDGENETLVFDSQQDAYKEYDKLINAGARIMSLELDTSL